MGASTTGAIQTVADADYIAVNLIAGFAYQFDIRGQAAGGGTLTTPSVSLLTASSSFVASGVTASVGDIRVSFTPNATGAYYLDVTGSSGTGTYTVNSAPTDDYTNTTATTGFVGTNGSTTGALQTVADTDSFAVALQQGITYRFDLEGQGSGAGTIATPALSLLSSNLAFVASSTMPGIGDARITYLATASSVAYLEVSGAGTGAYTLTDNAIACFVSGTRLATPDGQVAVEELCVGQDVMTTAGVARRIEWIGHRSYSGRFIRTNRDILPVCIRQGALADHMPARDLWVSPLHALFVDGVLISARDLINGASIVQAQSVDRVDYWHIELESHDVLLAENTPAESFIDDDGGRAMFHNSRDYACGSTEMPTSCAPRVTSGAELEAVRRRIAARALRQSEGGGDDQLHPFHHRKVWDKPHALVA